MKLHKQHSKTRFRMKNSHMLISIAIAAAIIGRTAFHTMGGNNPERFLDVTSRHSIEDQQCKDIRGGLDYIGQIDQDLQVLFSKGITEATLDEALNSIHRGVMVHIRDNRIFVKFKNNEEHYRYLDPYGLNRWRAQLQVFLKASCFAKLPDVDFVLFMPDKFPEDFPPHLPLFHFQKKRNGPGILIPYASHINDLGEFQKAIENEKQYQWDKKKSKLFWRGSTTGGHYNQTNWDSFPRSRLVLACDGEDIKEACDAAFIGFEQVDSEMKAFLKERFSLKDPISMEDHNKYKYVAWLDGNGPCSGRSEKLVSGNSLLFKQESQYTEFYYSGLQPQKHYISIKADMSDLGSQLAWARSHDDEARQMASQMHDFSHQLSPESIACYLQGLLERYASLLTYDLKPFAQLRDAQPVLPGREYGVTCRNPIYACKEYLRERNATVDSRLALLGDKGMVPKQCMHFFPMFKSQWKDYNNKITRSDLDEE